MKSGMTIAVGILTLRASPAGAADLRLPTKAPVMAAAPVYNWSGCYIGGNVGGKWGNSTLDVSSGAVPGNVAAAVGFGRDRSEGTFIGGGQIGCNWQAPGSGWVFGLEGDADWQRLRQTRTLGGAPPAAVSRRRHV